MTFEALLLSVADVDWPSGSYGLPKPKTGCPSDKKNAWYEGWRLQDMEDDDKSLSSRSRTSPGSHMSVTFNVDSKRDINRTFCIKQNTATGTQKYWPEGKFVQLHCCMAGQIEPNNIFLHITVFKQIKFHYYVPIVKVLLFMCFIGGERITGDNALFTGGITKKVKLPPSREHATFGQPKTANVL